jgi:hypothetical protein
MYQCQSGLAVDGTHGDSILAYMDMHLEVNLKDVIMRIKGCTAPEREITTGSQITAMRTMMEDQREMLNNPI